MIFRTPCQIHASINIDQGLVDQFTDVLVDFLDELQDELSPVLSSSALVQL